MHRAGNPHRERRPRSLRDLNQLRRAAEPGYAHGHAPLHKTDERLLKEVENLAHAVSLHYMHYNFARVHSSLAKKTTPAMAAGVADHVWTLREIAALLD